MQQLFDLYDHYNELAQMAREEYNDLMRTAQHEDNDSERAAYRAKAFTLHQTATAHQARADSFYQSYRISLTLNQNANQNG